MRQTPLKRSFRETVLCIGIFLFLTGCTAPRGRILGVEPGASVPTWTPEEEALDIAVKKIRVTDQASFHVIRLRGAEKPHAHDYHDLTVFMLSGKARLVIGDHAVTMKPGDVVEIPRGRMHWAENRASPASEVYAIFTPPLNEPDQRLIE